MLARVGTGDEWWTEPRVNQTLRFQDAESSVSLGNARAAVSAMLGTLSKYQDITDELGKAVRKACGLFDDAEVKIDADIEALLSGAAEVISSSSSSQAGAKIDFEQEGWSDYPWLKLAAKVMENLAGLLPIDILKNVVKLVGALFSGENIVDAISGALGVTVEWATGSSAAGSFAKSGAESFAENLEELLSGEITLGTAIAEWVAETGVDGANGVAEEVAWGAATKALQTAGTAIAGPVGMVVATILAAGAQVTCEWVAENTIGDAGDLADKFNGRGATAEWAG